MARWTNLIARQETTSQRRPGGMLEYRGVVVHTADGSYEGTISWQLGPNSVSSHFVVGKNPGQWCQMMDDHDGAWTQKAGNYHWLSVENEGHGDQGQPLTAWQVDANAQILAEAHHRFGVPLQIATNPDGKGLGHHSMGCNWPGGDWGHCLCPGNVIIAQKAEILARAKDIVGGDVNTAQETSAGHIEQMVASMYNEFRGDLGALKTQVDAIPNPSLDDAALDALADKVAARMAKPPTVDEIAQRLAERLGNG